MFVDHGGETLDCKFDRYQSRVVYFDEKFKNFEESYKLGPASPVYIVLRCRFNSRARLLHEIIPEHRSFRPVTFYKNPLAVLINAKEIEHRVENMDAAFENESIFENVRELSKQYDNGVFILHVNFGDENLESLQRIILVDRTKDQKYSEIVKRIMKIFSHSDKIKSNDKMFSGFFDEFGTVTRILSFYGYVTCISS